MTVTLGDIATRLAREGVLHATPGEPPGWEGIPISGVTADSRDAGPGILFCAVRGSEGDGHAYLGAAAAAGAVAALVEARNPDVALPQVEVRSGRRAASFAASEFHGDPWSYMTMVGVTGTNGKTTTAAVLRHLLGSRQIAASIGTLGAIGPDGGVIPGSEGLTTPGPTEVAGWLGRLRDDRVEAVVMEVSSHALDQSRVDAIRFDAALFTNLTRDHLDYHGTLEAYRESKLRLLDLLAPDGVAVLNEDDPAWRAAAWSGRTVRYGIAAGVAADVRAENIRPGRDGMEWSLRTPDGTERVRIPLFGLYNVTNALGAAATVWALGWGVDRIAAALQHVPQVPGRLERVRTPRGAPAVVIDFAHTPDALGRALAALRPLVPGRLIVVFGAGGDRDPGKRPGMGREAAAGADLSIITSDNPRSEDPAEIAREIESGMGGAPRETVLDRRAAIQRAIEIGRPEDLVLLAGKGHETYQIWGDEKRPFDERRVLEEIFAGRDGAA